MKRLITILLILLSCSVNGQFRRHIPLQQVSPITYATITSDKTANVGITGSGLIYTQTNDGNQGGARATIGKSSGKWQWEYTLTSSTTINFAFGLANLSASLTQYIGFDTNGWSVFENGGFKYTNNSFAGYAATINAGDVIDMLFDAGAGTITVKINNTNYGVMFSGLTGTLYPALGGFQAGNVVTCNFGQSPMVYPEGGYNQGVYN